MSLPRHLPLQSIVVAVALLCAGVTVSGQTSRGAVRGDVLDYSGGVLPGVTVAATAADGHVLATAVSDAEGRFVLADLPDGHMTLTFELADFETASIGLSVLPERETLVSVPLKVGAVTELVVVRGDTTLAVPQLEVPRVSLSRPSPPPQVRPVSLEDLESVCGPAKPGEMPDGFGSLQAHRYDAEQVLYRLGDEVIVEGGTATGLDVGHNLVARRYFRAPAANGAYARGEHTAGVVQIVFTGTQTSTAVVIHACNELMRGDVLAPFRPEPAVLPEPAGAPRYQDAARVLFADAGQTLGAERRLMVIDRGIDYGIRSGQRLTLFRPTLDRRGRVIVGQAVVTAVRPDSARIRVESASDAITAGDFAAPQQPAPGLRALEVAGVRP